MFDKETYISRRAALKAKMGGGLLLFPGNNPTPANYPNNCFHHRQDSSFLYFFGQQREGLFGVIDVDHDTTYLFGDDIDLDDIIWYGSVDSVASLAAETGISHSGSMADLSDRKSVV